MISDAIDKIKQIGYDRCGNCPAFWSSTDYWGEGDAGCQLNRDIEEFCSLSFFPKFAVKALIKREEKRLDKHYSELGERMEREEFEMECLQKALIKTLKNDQLEICWDGKKVDLSYQTTYEILKEFKVLREAPPLDSNTQRSGGRERYFLTHRR